jgi:hypothetical protein
MNTVAELAQQDLARSGLTWEDAQAAGIEALPADEIERRLGFELKAKPSGGLYIPYRSLLGEPVTDSLNPDQQIFRIRLLARHPSCQNTWRAKRAAGVSTSRQSLPTFLNPSSRSS